MHFFKRKATESQVQRLDRIKAQVAVRAQDLRANSPSNNLSDLFAVMSEEDEVLLRPTATEQAFIPPPPPAAIPPKEAGAAEQAQRLADAEILRQLAAEVATLDKAQDSYDEEAADADYPDQSWTKTY